MNRADLRAALGDANVLAFLRVIRKGESGQGEDAYRIRFGGSYFEAPPWQHPRAAITAGRWTSTAAGAYQFLARTWDGLVRQYAFPDFSPACQDEAAVALIAGRGALRDVRAGRFETAIRKCAREWASLPGSPYGQPVMTMAEARDTYERHGGTYASTKPTEPQPMSPLIIPALQLAAKFIPQIAAHFSSGSEVANRNMAAGKVLAEAITEATQSANIQEAVEKMEGGDREAVKAAQMAVAQVYPELFEVGGGILEARKSAYDPGQVAPWCNPAVWIAAAILPLVYLVVYAVLLGGGAFSDDLKALVVTAIVTGALGSVTGFFLGSSLGSQRKTGLIANKE